MGRSPLLEFLMMLWVRGGGSSDSVSSICSDWYYYIEVSNVNALMKYGLRVLHSSELTRYWCRQLAPAYECQRKQLLAWETQVVCVWRRDSYSLTASTDVNNYNDHLISNHYMDLYHCISSNSIRAGHSSQETDERSTWCRLTAARTISAWQLTSLWYWPTDFLSNGRDDDDEHLRSLHLD